MSNPPPAGKPKAGTKWVSRMGIPVRSPSLLGRQQPATSEQDTTLSKTVSRDTKVPASPPPASDTASIKSGPKWASKLGAAAKRAPSVVNLSRPTAASAAKERDSDTASIQTTASRESVAVSSRPGTPSTEPNGKGPKWASKLGAAARRSPSMLSLARPTAASAAKETDATPAPARKSVSPTPKPTSTPEASRRPSTPSGGKLPKAPSPPPAPTKAAKATKPAPSPAPPADPAGAKPKTKWTARVGGAVRRSSSLLSTTRPVTAAKEDAAPPARAPAYKASGAVPAVVRAPSSLSHEVDMLAESPTEEADASSAPAKASVEDLILDQGRAMSPIQDMDMELPSESPVDDAVDDTPEPRGSASGPFVPEADASERPASPFADDVSQELVEEPASIDIEKVENERPVSPFADEASPEVTEPAAEPVESDVSPHERLVSPFADVDSSEYAEEAPAQPLVLDTMVHERSSSPFADDAPSDYVEEPKPIIAEPLSPVVEEPAERSASPFEDVSLPAEDISPVIDSAAVESPSEPAHERATSPFDDAASVAADAHPADTVTDASVPAAEDTIDDLHPAASTPPAPTPVVLPDPAVSDVLVEAPLSGSAHIVAESDTAGTEPPVLDADEDPFADPPHVDEPWTIVDSQADVEHAMASPARDALVAVSHGYGLSGLNPWAASESMEREAADVSQLEHVRVGEVHAVEVANALVTAAESEAFSSADIVHPATVGSTNAVAVAAPVAATQSEALVSSAEPAVSPVIQPAAASPSTPAPIVVPGMPSRATLTPPTLSTITTPLRALRAPTLPPPAAHSDAKLLGNVWAAASAVLYHPLSQEESDESASPARAAGAGLGPGANGYGSAGRTRDVSTESFARAQAAGRAPAGPSAPRRTPRVDPYPPRPQSGASSRPAAGPGEENTTWNSVYEVIVGVISEIVTMSMRIIWRK